MDGEVDYGIELVVPGRLCLIGEHSDWAGGFRSQNDQIRPGMAIVACTNTSQVIRARVLPTSNGMLTLKHLPLSIENQIPLNLSCALDLCNSSNSLWTYVGGVICVFLERFAISHSAGMTISITEASLPMCKGLSSSAAICVLVARAFNQLFFNSSLTLDGEMELAYAGERRNGSFCGRLDQSVAFGAGSAVCMRFDTERVTCTPIKAKLHSEHTEPIAIVFADLNGTKSTSVILKELQSAYPIAKTEEHSNLHECLGLRNELRCKAACAAIEETNAKRLGEIFGDAQADFDTCAVPLSASGELISPRLHALLSDPVAKELSFGAKGVGSQGDGCVQFVARSLTDAQRLVNYLNSEKGGCKDATILVVPPPRPRYNDTIEEKSRAKRARSDSQCRIESVVVPCAGLGTRLYPASALIRPKGLMPVVDPRDSFLKPLLLVLLEECLVHSGIEQVILVVTPGQEEKSVRTLLSPPNIQLYQRLRPAQKTYSQSIQKWAHKVHIAYQDTPEGFGHAVEIGTRSLRKQEPFILLLGDVLLHTPLKTTVVSQAKECFRLFNGKASVIVLSRMKREAIGAYGCAMTEKVTLECLSGSELSGHVFQIVEVVEKPVSDDDLSRLVTENNDYFAILGPYAFTPAMTAELSRTVQNNTRHSGEIQLTPCIQNLLQTEVIYGLALDHVSPLDIGVPTEYAKTMKYILSELEKR
uniref:UTP--glucose-1-phosphate uridylyltransferase n=1 Tax=Timspurckia oligopyrenoides TaxID=708627 RepID=A0A7S0ZEP0_9RHOD|mmetsp:Transcript_2341/g.4102  ORF Transcript_2341/g.4102 Transcript_2341/m.4102 type:complete len:702 (+) Transcript_2341:185-2290(+)